MAKPGETESHILEHGLDITGYQSLILECEASRSPGTPRSGLSISFCGSAISHFGHMALLALHEAIHITIFALARFSS